GVGPRVAARDADCRLVLARPGPLYIDASWRRVAVSRLGSNDDQSRRAVDDDAEDPRELASLDRCRSRVRPDVHLQGTPGNGGPLLWFSCSPRDLASLMAFELPRTTGPPAPGRVERNVPVGL